MVSQGFVESSSTIKMKSANILMLTKCQEQISLKFNQGNIRYLAQLERKFLPLILTPAAVLVIPEKRNRKCVQTLFFDIRTCFEIPIIRGNRS